GEVGPAAPAGALGDVMPPGGTAAALRDVGALTAAGALGVAATADALAAAAPAGEAVAATPGAPGRPFDARRDPTAGQSGSSRVRLKSSFVLGSTAMPICPMPIRMINAYCGVQLKD